MAMDSRQARLARKKKKREKIRKEHLAKERREREKARINQPLFAPRPIQLTMPHKDDMLGWQRANALTKDAVLAKVRVMFPEDKLLWRFLRHGDISKHDLDYISYLMTEAARKLCCQPPYYIPFVQVTKDAFAIASLKLEKMRMPTGSAWYYEDGGYRWRTIVDGHGYPFALHTHAADRLYERLNPMPLGKIARVLVEMLPLQAVKIGDDWVVPIHLPHQATTIGYCPINIHFGTAVGISFLLPYMRGTPQHEKLRAAGRHDLIHDDFKDLGELIKFEEKAAAVLSAEKQP